MSKIAAGHFDRLVWLILGSLALALAGAGLLASWRGLRAPELVSPTVGAKGPIGLAFSQKMQANTVEPRLSFTPPLSGRAKWDGNTLWYWPAAALQPGQAYLLSLASGALSEDGQEIKSPTTFSIQVRAPQLAYLSPAAAGSELWVAPADGTGPAQVSQTGNQVIDFDASYDGGRFVFSAQNAQTGTDLWVIRRDGSNSHKVLDCGGDHCTQPAWSPDGKRIAYSRIRLSVSPGETYTTAPRLWTLDVETLKTAPLFQDPATTGTNPAWSPDGNFLAFYSPAAKVIHALNVTTGKDLLLRSQAGGAGVWTADSSTLFFGDFETSESLPYGGAYQANVLTDEVTPLFQSAHEPQDVNPPAPAPDGSWVVVGVKSRGGSHSVQLVKQSPDGSASQPITQDHLFSHGAYKVDPTGQKVVYQRILLGSSSARPEVWVWDAASGSARLVASNATQPAWLP